jgi:hypothetical protein
MMKDSLEDYIPYNAQSLLDSPSPKIRQLVREYVALSTKQSPSEADSDRLAAILQLAESDDKLALWIVALDAVISRKIGLLDPETYADYERQHELLITCLSEHTTNNEGYEGQRELVVSCASVPQDAGRASVSRPAEIEKSFSIDPALYHREAG